MNTSTQGSGKTAVIVPKGVHRISLVKSLKGYTNGLVVVCCVCPDCGNEATHDISYATHNVCTGNGFEVDFSEIDFNKLAEEICKPCVLKAVKQQRIA